jgi:hypothetical protein
LHCASPCCRSQNANAAWINSGSASKHITSKSGRKAASQPATLVAQAYPATRKYLSHTTRLCHQSETHQSVKVACAGPNIEDKCAFTRAGSKTVPIDSAQTIHPTLRRAKLSTAHLVPLHARLTTSARQYMPQKPHAATM